MIVQYVKDHIVGTSYPLILLTTWLENIALYSSSTFLKGSAQASVTTRKTFRVVKW